MGGAVTIYHNPACGNSRGALQLIRAAGIEPVIIEYLKTPPDRATLVALLQRMGLTVRQLMRDKEPLYAQLGLGASHWSDEQLLDQMLAHPILINRPVVISERGARLCRPPETVREILPG